MKRTKFKLFGMVLATGLFVFSLTACQQNKKKKDDSGQNKTEAVAAESQQNSAEETADENGSKTLTGEILDMSCFMDHGAKGQGHKKCAQSCLDKGLPAGILADNGQVYLLIQDHDNAEAYNTAIKHAAETVTIKGNVINKGGLQSIVIEGINLQG